MPVRMFVSHRRLSLQVLHRSGSSGRNWVVPAGTWPQEAPGLDVGLGSRYRRHRLAVRRIFVVVRLPCCSSCLQLHHARP